MSVPSTAFRVAGAAAVGYLLGMFPTADIVARRTGDGTTDLRATGSGNPGTANAMNVLGARAGLTVLAGDVAKGVVACAAGAALAGPVGAHVGGTAAVAGHCFPATNGFRGGKGVAASVGQCLATFPAYFPIDVAVAAATAANPTARERAFEATVASSACWVLGGVLWWRAGWRNLWGPRPTIALPLANLASAAMILKRFLDAR